MTSTLRIVHRPSGLLLAEGPSGWGITRFEGNYYVRWKYLRTGALEPAWIPGLCPYKGLYVWLDLRPPRGEVVRNLAWLYWLPNPLLPFVAFRVAFSGTHADLLVEETVAGGEPAEAPPAVGTGSPSRRWGNPGRAARVSDDGRSEIGARQGDAT